MPEAKKFNYTFDKNPASAFLTQEEAPPQETAEVDQAKVASPSKREAKSRRLGVLMKPSLYDRVKKIADEYEISVNDLINKITLAFVQSQK